MFLPEVAFCRFGYTGLLGAACGCLELPEAAWGCLGLPEADWGCLAVVFNKTIGENSNIRRNSRCGSRKSTTFAKLADGQHFRCRKTTKYALLNQHMLFYPIERANDAKMYEPGARWHLSTCSFLSVCAAYVDF